MKRSLLLIAVTIALSAVFIWLRPSQATAVAPPQCAQKDSSGNWQKATCPSFLASGKCFELDGSGGVTTIDCATYPSLIGAGATNTGCPALGTPGLNLDCSGGKNPIYALLQFAINWLIRLLGVLAVLAIVFSGIQYTTSQGNPDGLKKAKSRLTNAVVGLILLSLMFVILHVLGIT